MKPLKLSCISISTTPLYLQQRLFRIAMLLLIFAGWALLRWWHPMQLSISECCFHSLTGVSCPTCGLSRSLHAGADLQWISAAQFHILGPVVLLILMLISIKLMAEVIIRKKISFSLTAMVKKSIIFGILSIWLIFFLIRLIAELKL
ncbi:MAG TPA: DUF2752 domain-containing protein [bacterium]|nr:DUF2752 domain-containing protein [bacterium]